MPRSKRPLTEADPNAEPPSKSSKGKSKQTGQPTSDAPDEVGAEDVTPIEVVEESTSASNDKENKIPMDKEDPYEDEKGEDALDEEELEEQHEKEVKSSKHDQPAMERPDHKWVLMRRSWIKLCDASREASYRSPDNFGMYIYNDFEGYGLLEMVENFIVEYSKEFKKKTQNFKDMWIPLVAFTHWIKMNQMGPLFMIDDGERLSATLELAGRAFLSMLNALDRAGQLKPDSDLKDLGLIMGLFAGIASDFQDAYNMEDELDWEAHILKYAKDKNIDVGVSFEGKKLANKSDDGDSDEEGFNEDDTNEWPKAANDRWSFSKKLKEHKDTYELLGGTEYDITKMSRAQRAEHAFDKKDPLADVPLKDLKEGNLMLQSSGM